jgi:hypothetical protein
MSFGSQYGQTFTLENNENVNLHFLRVITWGFLDWSTKFSQFFDGIGYWQKSEFKDLIAPIVLLDRNGKTTY